MRHYLSTLHQRSDSHKKRFALFTSAGTTLLIFGIWASVNFGGADATLAQEKVSEVEVSPLRSLLGEVGASLGILKSNLNELKQGLEVVNFEASQYTNSNTNGR